MDSTRCIAHGTSGRSRISPGGGRGPPTRVLSVKMYVKMKELGPIGGGVHPARPPRSANGYVPRPTTLLGYLMNAFLHKHIRC